MIISDQQVQLVLEYLHNADESSGERTESIGDAVTPELVERVKAALESVPETRADRMAEARELLAASDLTSREVADKMIGRLISDSLR